MSKRRDEQEARYCTAAILFLVYTEQTLALIKWRFVADRNEVRGGVKKKKKSDAETEPENTPLSAVTKQTELWSGFYVQLKNYLIRYLLYLKVYYLTRSPGVHL